MLVALLSSFSFTFTSSPPFPLSFVFVLLRLSPSASCVPILPLLFLLPSQPQFESHLRSLARATINTKRNSGVYRNVLMYGPPGTGKTMFAKVGKWDKDMSAAVRRGGKGGRGGCVSFSSSSSSYAFRCCEEGKEEEECMCVCLFLLLFLFLLLLLLLLLLLFLFFFLLLSPSRIPVLSPSLRVLLVTLEWTMLS